MCTAFKGKVTVLFGFLLLFFFSSLFLVHGFPSISGDCTTCHDDSTGMTITPTQTNFLVESGGTFNLNISATGIVGKFPNDLVDNSDFNYTGLDDEGMVEDGDTNDLDPELEQLLVQYLIAVPNVSGDYTLRFFAAKHTPYSDSVDISVTVFESTASSSIDPTITTSTPSSPPPPQIPWINIFAIFNLNFIFSWVFLTSVFLGLVLVSSRGKPKPPLLFVGVLIATFGWASYYTYGLDPVSAIMGLGGFLLATYAERKSRSDLVAQQS